jgi:hypothetical protein
MTDRESDTRFEGEAREAPRGEQADESPATDSSAEEGAPTEAPLVAEEGVNERTADMVAESPTGSGDPAEHSPDGDRTD